jgi:hypothetical protein
MRRSALLAAPLVAALGLAAFGLAACNSPTAPPAPGAVVVTPSDANLPQGGDCAAVIARYRAVVESDASTGNLERPVYKRIAAEIAPAERACAAGRDAQARSMIATSAQRHGYPASL